VTSIHDHVRSYITLLDANLNYISSLTTSQAPLPTGPPFQSLSAFNQYHAKPLLTTRLQWPIIRKPSHHSNCLTYQNIRRQNAVLLSVLAAGGAGYWLIKSRSLQRDQKRQEQIYIQGREHIDTTKRDH
jgi:hypothetical protein